MLGQFLKILSSDALLPRCSVLSFAMIASDPTLPSSIGPPSRCLKTSIALARIFSVTPFRTFLTCGAFAGDEDVSGLLNGSGSSKPCSSMPSKSSSKPFPIAASSSNPSPIAVSSSKPSSSSKPGLSKSSGSLSSLPSTSSGSCSRASKLSSACSGSASYDGALPAYSSSLVGVAADTSTCSPRTSAMPVSWASKALSGSSK
mmetsp:Transcript_3112/g.5592  ORF Transcript_3112/g.5592 Transcript_3112/m.5592 type:complete len:202 (+) Transcript_3112:373-978(+)